MALLNGFRKNTTSLILGLDFGHSNCRAAYILGESTSVAHLDHHGNPHCPSIVCQNIDDKSWSIGHDAEQEIWGTNRVKVQNNLRSHIQLPTSQIPVQMNYGSHKDIKPEDWEHSARRLFTRICSDVIESTRAEGTAASAIAVPLYYSAHQRQKLRECITLPDLDLIDEPEAAVLGYRLHENLEGGERLIAIFNLGGGSCWCVILRLLGQQGAFRTEVLSEEYGRGLGGDSVDARLWDLLMVSHAEELPTRLDSMNEIERGAAEQQIRLAIRQMKHSLTHRNGRGDKNASRILTRLENLQISLTQDQIQAAVDESVMEAHDVVVRALRGAGVSSGKIQHTLPVGGMSRHPSVQSMLRMMMPQVEHSPTHIAENMDQLCIARGAAYYAALKGENTQDIRFIALERPAVGIKISNERFDPIISVNAPLQIARSKVYSSTVRDAKGVTFDIYCGFSQGLHGNQLVGQIRYPFIETGGPDDYRRDLCRLAVTLRRDSLDEITVTVVDTGREGDQMRRPLETAFREYAPGKWKPLD